MRFEGNKEEQFEFLDALRESGDTNMFAARPYLMEAFPELEAREAGAVLAEWMVTFTKRHPQMLEPSSND